MTKLEQLETWTGLSPVVFQSRQFSGWLRALRSMIGMLEILVHANLGIVPDTHAAVSIEIPDNIAVERLDSSTAAGWDVEDLLASREFGDRWFKERRTAVLLVPSVVLQGRELNVVFNPEHADFGHVRSSVPEPVLWDPRLFSRPR